MENKKAPHHKNAFDCGIFTLSFAEKLMTVRTVWVAYLHIPSKHPHKLRKKARYDSTKIFMKKNFNTSLTSGGVIRKTKLERCPPVQDIMQNHHDYDQDHESLTSMWLTCLL